MCVSTSRTNCLLNCFISLCLVNIILLKVPQTLAQPSERVINVTCSELRMGQYRCNTTSIDPATQQPRGCRQGNVADVECEAAPGLRCRESNGASNIFTKEIPCKWTNGYSYSTALLLSVFMGMLGADRFYLGHLGMGALKFCTLGFLFIGHIVDIILIATQAVLPHDGSNYVVGYYGPAVLSLRSNNLTYVVRKPDWSDLWGLIWSVNLRIEYYSKIYIGISRILVLCDC